MNDIAQTNLKQPEQVDWDNLNAGSKLSVPPDAYGPDGKMITYYGVATAAEIAPDDEYLNYLLDPIKIVKSGSADGYTIRFTRASVKPRTKKDGTPIKGNPNRLAEYLKGCGLSAKPQTNEQYRLAVQQANGKAFPFVGDWEAYNKDTGESVKGFYSFPVDPTTGQRKFVLKAGDVYNIVGPDGKPTGQTGVVKSEILFANFRLRWFQDPTRQRS